MYRNISWYMYEYSARVGSAAIKIAQEIRCHAPKKNKAVDDVRRHHNTTRAKNVILTYM